MLNLCTVADSEFLLKFLALRKSVRKHTFNYNFHLLCLDQKIYNNLNNRYKDVNCYKLETLLEKDSKLKQSQFNDPSFEALNVSNGDTKKAKRIQFIWSLASYFSWYCMTSKNLQSIYYVDCDIYFFNNPEILKTISNFGSIGLIENRTPYSAVNGKYNVGIIYFKNNLNGLSCLEFWKDCLLDNTNKYYKKYGTCGDQKYLELFEQLYEGVFNLDDYIGHLAPWNVNNHKYLLGKIVYEEKMQEILFYHFSNFLYDFQKKFYSYAPRHGLHTAPNNTIATLYQEYYKALEELNENNIWNDSI